MKTTGRLLTLVVSSLFALVVTAQVALAQVAVDPSTTPTRNTGGWISGITIGLAAIGIIVAVWIVVTYMRYAPRFATDEESFKVVRADRVLPGREAPRRAVDLSQAAPVVVPPPALPVAAGVAAPAAEPAAAPAAVAPAAPAPVTPAPAAEAPAPATPAAPPAAPAPAPAEERPEVSLDQEVFEKTLQELLDAGTDRRIAEGKARRAAMIAARKKAAGEG